MKKIILAVICLLIFALAACGSPSGNVVVVTKTPGAVSENPSTTETAEETAANPAQSETPAETQSAAPSPTPADAPKMYTSYAYMVSFDAATGTAEFDYFDMLRGEDAVKWLVEQEGCSQSGAEARVKDFADSEFIEKNTNTQLRTIDLSEIPVYLIINDDGTSTDLFEPRLVDIDTLKAIYANDPSALLELFFYQVKVSESGTVESVNQVYWP
jgi:hypothetical protein